MRRIFAGAVVLVFLSSVVAAAQDHHQYEVAGGLGRMFISDRTVPGTNFFNNTIHSGKGLSVAGSFTRELHAFRWGALEAEIPVIYDPDEDLNYGQNQIPEAYSALFVTPAAHLVVMQDLAFSPWISLGGGFAHFSASKNLVFGGANPGPRGKTSGALHGGVGFDVRLPGLQNLKFRFEARDNWSSTPPLNINTGKTHQHYIYVGGGLVFAF